MKYLYVKNDSLVDLRNSLSQVIGDMTTIIRIPGFVADNVKYTPIPKSKKVYTFEKLVEDRAKELLKKYDSIYVLWSAGADSTLVAASLLKYKTDQKIYLTTTSTVLRDADKNMLSKIGELGGTFVELSREVLLSAAESGAAIISGTHADSIFMNDKWNNASDVDITKMTFVDIVMHRLGCSEFDAKFHEFILTPLIKLIPISPTGYNIMWWLNFISTWDYDEFEMPFALNIPTKYISTFYGTTKFQTWAIQEPEMKLVEGSSYSKQRIVNLLNEYLGCQYKVVENVLNGQSKSITDARMDILHQVNFSLLYIDEELNFKLM